MPEIYDVLSSASQEMVFKMSWSDYRKVVAMNPSTLVHGLESMKKLKWEWDNPSKSTAAMEFGSAVHTLVFEPRKFSDQYVSWDGSRRGKDFKEFAAESFLDRKKVLTCEEFDAVQVVALSVAAREEVKSLVSAGQPEVGLFWMEGDVRCKGRVDWLCADSASVQPIVDLKTANDVSERGRGRAFFKYHYDVKLGLYQRAVEKVTGRQRPVCVIWVENKPPYDVVIDDGWIPQAVLDSGVDKALEVFRRLTWSLKNRVWQGHGGPLFVPNYEMLDEQLVEFHDD